MSSNSSSTDTAVPATTSFSQTPSATTTSSSASMPPSSSSIANSSPTSVPSTELSSSRSSSSVIVPSSSISSIESTTSTPPSTSSTSARTSTTPTTTATPSDITSASPSLVTITQTPTSPGGSTVYTVITSTAQANPGSSTTSATSSSLSAASTAGLQTGSKTTSSSGLSSGGTIAVAVVVPIVAVGLIILAGLYFWKKRKQRKDAEELRRKEVEEYGYNPNNDPTLPAVGGVGSSGNDGPYEMREDGSTGYRGWGTTAVASSGRKASTALSSGQSPGAIGMAYSEGTSPTHGPVSDTRSDNPLMDRPLSGEIEPLGAMGPAASGNRGGDINRGPSNASSQYSAAGRSDGSGDIPGGFGAQYYNNQYDTGNPYSPDTPYGSPPGRPAEMPAQPVIRDVQARRNTRIENPAHFPQQSAGISQNF